MLNADADRGESLVVGSSLRSHRVPYALSIQVGTAPASLHTIVRRVCHVSQQEQPRLQIHAASEEERGGLRASTRAVAGVEVAEAA